MRYYVFIIGFVLFCTALTAFSPQRVVKSSDCTRASVGLTPLIDLTSSTYLGFEGGLYPAGSNQIPSDHQAAGLNKIRDIRPLDVNGNPTPSGKVVLLSVGMSNTSNEFCGGSVGGCAPESFVSQAAGDSDVNHSTLVIVNGAQGGNDAEQWISPSGAVYDVVRTQRLGNLGLSEKQVQVVWLKQANAGPTASLTDESADAYLLEKYLGMTLRTLKERYPNLQQVFLSSRIYAGYATTNLNPEVFSYESGFSVKWLIEAQINQMRGGQPDPRAGDLKYTTVAPWIAWGPYLWADGMVERSDGLFWQCSDFNSDGTHPAESGRRKAAAMLLNFFKSHSTTRSWFLEGPQPAVSISGKVVSPDGRGIRGALVTLFDETGLIRKTTTSSLGFYSFPQEQIDRNYSITAASKRFRFERKQISVTSDMEEVNLVGVE